VGDAAASSQTAGRGVAELVGISTEAASPNGEMIGQLLAGAL
jgi:hypothetical protein